MSQRDTRRKWVNNWVLYAKNEVFSCRWHEVHIDNQMMLTTHQPPMHTKTKYK